MLSFNEALFNLNNFVIKFEFLGRILNRFAKDTGVIDEILPSTAFELQLVFQLIQFYLFIWTFNFIIDDVKCIWYFNCGFNCFVAFNNPSDNLNDLSFYWSMDLHKISKRY